MACAAAMAPRLSCGAADVCAPAEYAIERELGRGGFGVVYLARRGEHRVALKVAHEGAIARERLTREAAALRAVGAPHTPALLRDGTSAERAFLELEYVALPTLRE